jgi:hypothetical protein
MKDISSEEDHKKARALRLLATCTSEISVLQQADRFLKYAAIDQNLVISSAGLIAG